MRFARSELRNCAKLSDLAPKPNNLPKRHHFVPQMILRHFTDDEEKLWFWRENFAPGDVKNAPTKFLFMEKDLYTRVLPNGEKDVELENFYARIEGAGAKFITDLSAIVRAGKEPELDDGAWEFWSNFFYYHMKRAPKTFQAVEQQSGFEVVFDNAVAKVKQARRESGRDADQPELDKIVKKNAIVMAQRSPPSPAVKEALAKLGLAIYYIADASKSYIVGDHPSPMAKFRTPTREWSHPTLFIPLTWDIAVGPLSYEKRVELIRVDREQVRRMNEATAEKSTIIAGRSKELINSLSFNR